LHRVTAPLAVALLAACSTSTAPSPQPPPPNAGTANAYILPGAVGLAANAFGDQPVVVRRGERLRWRNADVVEHNVIADAASFPEFRSTGLLAPGGEASFGMNTRGTTRIHCTIHPQMVGTLVVAEQ
jgi:plastocyanin